MLADVCKFKYLVYFVLLFFVNIIRSEDQNITISLNKTLTQDNKELFGEFMTLKSKSTLSITLTNVNKNVSFIVLQAHSHLYNITMYQNILTWNTSSTGTNVGLYGTVSAHDSYFVLNKNLLDIKLYISVHGYYSTDPIPGGCNGESNVKISPFMHVNYTKDMIKFDAPPAQDPVYDPKCNFKSSRARVIYYRMYLNERDFGEDSYFYGLMNMMTLGKIKLNGIMVPVTKFFVIPRRFLSAYPGTGAVYVAVAYIKDSYSIYVPIHTYACSPPDGCEVLDDTVSQVFCACLMFIGLFVCFFGHRFFKTEMFLMGTLAGIIITYILISIWTDLERPAILGASLLTGSFFGAIWILLWWFYGIPVLSVALATMHLGFMLAAVIYHCAPGGNVFFTSDAQFWSIFILLMVGVSLTLTTVSYISNIICCAILGSYAVIFPIDHYVNSNLKYILYNTVRRAVVEDFNYAVLALPYQWRDVLVTLLWIVLATCGFLFQYYHNRGRPPFPPPPRSLNPVAEPMTYGAIEGRRRFFGIPYGLDQSATDAANERTPLLESSE